MIATLTSSETNEPSTMLCAALGTWKNNLVAMPSKTGLWVIRFMTTSPSLADTMLLITPTLTPNTMPSKPSTRLKRSLLAKNGMNRMTSIVKTLMTNKGGKMFKNSCSTNITMPTI